MRDGLEARPTLMWPSSVFSPCVFRLSVRRSEWWQGPRRRRAAALCSPSEATKKWGPGNTIGRHLDFVARRGEMLTNFEGFRGDASPFVLTRRERNRSSG